MYIASLPSAYMTKESITTKRIAKMIRQEEHRRCRRREKRVNRGMEDLYANNQCVVSTGISGLIHTSECHFAVRDYECNFD